MTRTLCGLLATAMLVVPAGWAASPAALVVCAPGYPGSTVEAQPTMSHFAAAAAQAAGLRQDALYAVYHEQEAAGVERLKQPDAALAMVPLPFFLTHARELGLAPVLQAVQKGGAPNEGWTLVAKRGRVANAAALDGFELISLAAYAPRFVDKVALQGFGPLPSTIKYTFSLAVLSALRRVVAGENVVVLLDAPQAMALPKLPFAADLETLKQSLPFPSVLLCTVGAHARDSATKRLLTALPRLHDSAESATALDAIRVARFVPLDTAALERARVAFGPLP